MKKLKNVKKKSLIATFSLPEYTSGYQIQIATSKNFKKGKKTFTLPFANGITKKDRLASVKSPHQMQITDLKKNKTYYVRVRVYEMLANGKKVYSTWSNVKKVKIKK
jgi:hypothetical protein